MGKRADAMKSEVFRRRVREMLAAGYSLARIAKETGKSIAYVTMIAAQEKANVS